MKSEGNDIEWLFVFNLLKDIVYKIYLPGQFDNKNCMYIFVTEPLGHSVFTSLYCLSAKGGTG